MSLETVPAYDPHRLERTDGTAIVVGASMAGLFAARVLADRYATVTVLDRDSLVDEPLPRDGVPQSTQPHALLTGGRATIEDLFPGYADAILAAGGVEVDLGADVEFYDDGVKLAGSGIDREMLCASRPLFELIVRRRLAATEGVELRGDCPVLDYHHDEDRAAVTGVRIRAEAGETATLEADLVVDATGRTSRTPGWLSDHGYPAPPLDEVHIDLQYGTVQVRRPPGDCRTILLPASHPNPRGGLAVPVEGDRWILNLHGFHGDHPPADLENFRAFADGLEAPVLADLLDSGAITVDSVDRYPIPSSRRFRYERLDRFPDGLVVLGDAIASFNPIYAQGMTVAAFEALLLHDELATGERGLASRFFEAAAAVVDVAWSMGVGPDFAFPETEGPRPSGSRIAGWYVGRLQRRARDDPVLTEALTRVIQFERPPSSLFRPGILWRVLSPFGGRGAGPTPASGSTGATPTRSED